MPEARLPKFEETGVVAVLRGVGLARAGMVAEAALQAKLGTLEFTYDTPGALAAIRDLKEKYREELEIGCGTIKKVDQAEEALEAGADFLVSPYRPDEVGEWCLKKKVMYIPAGHMPQHVGTIIDELHPDWIKIFPAGTGGPEHVRQLRGPFSPADAKFVVSGGVRLENIDEYIEAGADAISLGGTILHESLEETNGYRLASIFLEAIHQVAQSRLKLEATQASVGGGEDRGSVPTKPDKD